MILSSTFIFICVCQLKAIPSVVILTDNYSTVALGLVNPLFLISTNFRFWRFILHD